MATAIIILHIIGILILIGISQLLIDILIKNIMEIKGGKK